MKIIPLASELVSILAFVIKINILEVATTSAVERGGQGGKQPWAPRQKGGPAIPKKKLFDNFSILTANVNPFHVSC